MLKKLQTSVLKLLKDKEFESDHELYLYLLLMVAIALVGVVHVILAGFFLFAQISVMTVLSLASLSLDGACVFLAQKKSYAVCGLLLSASVGFYTLLSVCFLGGRSQVVFYLLAVFMMQVTIPYASKKTRIAVGILLYLLSCVAVWADFRYVPVFALGRMQLPLAILNMHIGFGSTIAQVVITQGIRTIVVQYNENKLEDYKKQANTDPLTGLYNRRYAEAFFEELARSKAGTWCVAMMDVDDFKMVNDRYGHNTGDAVLRMLSETMRDTLRKTDILIRWGGEEFLILLADVDSETAAIILNKLRAIISSNKVISATATVTVTVTIGVSRLDPNDIEGSINDCDKLLYAGKMQGKNMVAAL